jgi:23S rRNA maturation mini-RNase III
VICDSNKKRNEGVFDNEVKELVKRNRNNATDTTCRSQCNVKDSSTLLGEKR